MTTLGIIGSGNIGSTVARLATAAGYDVVISNSRGPASLVDLVAELGDRARAGTVVETVKAGHVVLVAVPLHAYRSVPAELLTGKVVVDADNYYPERDGRIPALDDESTTTSELLQDHLGAAHVVKAFNNIAAAHLGALARPAGAPDRAALPIAGDDEAARATVAELLDRVGYDHVDAGPLTEGWRFQRDTAAYVTPYFGPGGFDDPHPATAAEITAHLAAAVRYRDMVG